MRKILLLIVLATQFVMVWAVDDQIITTGVGPTQREALMAAQRKAIEQGVGVYVDAQSLSKNLELVEDKIFSKARGYVKKYTVISEKKIGAGNWEVTIECEVAADKIKNSLNAIGALRDKMGNPRIMVICDMEIKTDSPWENDPLISEAYEGIVERLTEREFPVVDPKISNHSIMGKSPSQEESYKKSVQLGLREKAEYILVYSIKPGEKESTDIFKKGWIMISAKIINTSSGQIVASQGKKVLGADKDDFDFAYRKAARKAGKLVAQFLENKLIDRWQLETVSGRVVVLELKNIGKFSMLVEFTSELKNSDGVKNVFQRSSTLTDTEYEIMYVGDTGTLKENIYTILKKMGLKPKAPFSSGDSIRIEF